MKDRICLIAFVALVLTIWGLCLRWDFYLWRLEHPTTPAWVWWIRSEK